MKTIKAICVHLCLSVVVFFLASPLRATTVDQAMPANHPPLTTDAPPIDDSAQKAFDALSTQDRTDFLANIHLSDLQTLAIDHEDQIKILDSWARQSLFTITRHSSLDGHPPLYTAIDMMWRPELYYVRNILYVQAVPLRLKLAPLAEGATEEARLAEQTRILKEATISPQFYDRPEVQEVLKNAQDSDAIMAPQVTKVRVAYFTFMRLEETFRILPAADDTTPWVHPMAVLPNFSAGLALIHAGNTPAVPKVNYDAATSEKIAGALQIFHDGWRNNDYLIANKGIADLVAIIPPLAPHIYPSALKRNTELHYNQTFNGTLFCAFYLLAFVLFAIAAYADLPRVRPWALTAFTIAILLHLSSMLVRSWLAGRYPVQNEFESIMSSALLGCIAGYALELWKRNSLFGMAFSFVGTIAMLGCMAAPYLSGRDIGGNISRVAGVLDDTWLYIHVTMVISSYALIAASAMLGAGYWLSRLWFWISPLEDSLSPALALAGAPALLSTPRPPNPSTPLESARRLRLERFDAVNIVVLQLAFWLLGAGIICGAIWADHSWGRPWGWDPKETFALVTWLVYLIIIHMRVVIPREKAPLTAALAIAGFAIMMFNWIGVNFFLVGLHSYA